jgi:hypothetical protein
MRLHLENGGRPEQLLQTMRRESHEYLRGKTPKEISRLVPFLALGIAAAQAESRLLIF